MKTNENYEKQLKQIMIMIEKLWNNMEKLMQIDNNNLSVDLK
jgi:hypothetical protein